MIPLFKWCIIVLSMFMMCYLTQCGLVTPVGDSDPGARPTNDISIEFEIGPKFAVLWFKIYSTDHNKIEHTSFRIRSKYHWWDGRLVRIGSGNGLLPDSTKPLPEPMLTYHQLSAVTTTEGNFTWNTSTMKYWNKLEKNFSFISPRGQWGNGVIPLGTISKIAAIMLGHF